MTEENALGGGRGHRGVDGVVTHVGVLGPAPHVANLRQHDVDGVGRRGRPLSEAVRCPLEPGRGHVVDQGTGDSQPIGES